MNRILFSIFVAFSLLVTNGCSDNNVVSAFMPKTINKDGVVVFVVYDGSGSMKESVLNTNGREEPKFQIANRALIAVGTRFDNYLSANTNRTLVIGIVVLNGGRASFESFTVINNGVTSYLQNWISHQSEPDGGTPLGNAMQLAAENMAKIQGTTKMHMIVLTDGASNNGPEPKEVLPSILSEAKAQGIDLGVHCVAFDVGSEVFGNLKQQGATVLEAKNETELNNQFDFILMEKILLEREE